MDSVIFSTAFRLPLGPIQIPVQWVPAVLSVDVKRPAKLTRLLYIVPSLRMRGFVPPVLQYVFMLWYLANHMGIFTLL
jgi:hypothetical protein